MFSVQVETAWGVLGGTGPYAGVERDFTDFPFVQLLGLFSYPYFSFARAEDLPTHYYSRLLNSRTLPVPPNLALFTHIGLTDSDFQAKPALAARDALFARRYVQ
jgi:hypothetical protein